MKIVTTNLELRAIVRSWKERGLTIGLVPTMGWFHEGHLALMKTARRESDRVIVTLFVNPRQFGPSEDLDNYPRDLERDFSLAEKTGSDVIFSPPAEEIYPAGYQTNVSVKDLSLDLCGASRPGHFDGVTTIVTKLFNLTQPTLAVFGEKDFQQLAIIRRLVKDLNFDIQIIGHPIVREPDGVAMSSRNSYLKKDERQYATCLNASISHVKNRLKNTQNALATDILISEVRKMIESTPLCEVDYIKIIDKNSLLPETTVTSNSVLALAVFINQNIRLIDNAQLIDE